MWFYYALFFALWTAASSPIIKHLTRVISPIAIIIIANLFIIPMVFFLIQLQGGVPHVTSQFYVLIFMSAILDAIAFVASFYAVKMSPISLISPIGSFNPVFTTLIAVFTLGEVPTLAKFFGILTIIIGSYLLNIKDIHHGLFAPFKKLFSDTGVRLFFLTNVLWAITPTFQKKAIFETSPQLPIYASFIGLIFVTIMLSPFFFKRVKQSIEPVKRNIGWFVLIGIFAAISQYAAFTAFAEANVGYVTAVFKLSTLFTIIFGWFFFKEERISERLLGASVMIVGTLLLVL